MLSQRGTRGRTPGGPSPIGCACTIAEPVGSVPVLARLTQKWSPQRKSRTAGKVSVLTDCSLVRNRPRCILLAFSGSSESSTGGVFLGLDQFTGKVFHLMGDLPTLTESKKVGACGPIHREELFGSLKSPVADHACRPCWPDGFVTRLSFSRRLRFNYRWI